MHASRAGIQKSAHQELTSLFLVFRDTYKLLFSTVKSPCTCLPFRKISVCFVLFGFILKEVKILPPVFLKGYLQSFGKLMLFF